MKPVIIIPAYQPDEKLLQLVDALTTDGSQRVIVVNDGSDPKCNPIFSSLAANAHVDVLSHAENLGKGYALKTAFNYFLSHYRNDCPGVVTADADGQHAVEDIAKLSAELVAKPQQLALGAREFSEDVPLRSQLGNKLTRNVFALFVGKKIRDTQTGLRAIPTAFLSKLLRLRSTGYDYELDMLITAVQEKLPIKELPIKTIYIDNNSASHFNPLIDSMKIYFVFLRFSAVSMMTAVIDFAAFFISYKLWVNILLCTAIGRVFGGTFGFIMGKRYTFKSSNAFKPEVIKYISLVLLLMLVSYALVSLFVVGLHLPIYPSKLVAEFCVFLLSFSLQRLFVFRPVLAIP